MEASSPVEQKPSAPQSQAANAILAKMVRLAVTSLKAESFDRAANIIVNQVHSLIRTERAILIPLTGAKRIIRISGDLEPSQDNPYSQAVHEIRRVFQNDPEPRIVNTETLPDGIRAPNAEKVLGAMGGTQVLWLPLQPGGDQEVRYALWLERWNNRPWTPEEIRILSHAAVFFGQALGVPRKKVHKRSGKRTAFLLIIVIFLILWLPVNSRVSAPAQVVPDHPYYVFAPFDGIVEDLAVQPGETVAPGDLIFKYDTRVLEKQLEEAQRGVATAMAELARLEGAGYADEEARAKIPVQKLEVKRKEAEVAFLQTQLELSEVRTESSGVVVLDDPDALIGAALQTGEMVLSVADPANTKLHLMIPVADAGLVTEGAPVAVRLDSDPLRAFQAKVDRIGFDVRVSDERVPSVFVEAVWEDPVRVTPGQRGTSAIQGPEMPLGLQLFRKPLMTLRTWIGV